MYSSPENDLIPDSSQTDRPYGESAAADKFGKDPEIDSGTHPAQSQN